jgi:hypothetical protein
MTTPSFFGELSAIIPSTARFKPGGAWKRVRNALRGNGRRDAGDPGPPEPLATPTITRQTSRHRLFDARFKRLPFNAVGTRKEPLASRRERRNLARARAAGEWREAVEQSGRGLSERGAGSQERRLYGVYADRPPRGYGVAGWRARRRY